jgi:hypothetical protein
MGKFPKSGVNLLPEVIRSMVPRPTLVERKTCQRFQRSISDGNRPYTLIIIETSFFNMFAF